MTTLEPGSFVDRYQIVRFVAAGGMCLVYEARAPGESHSVAVKVLHDIWQLDGEIARRFANEVHALQTLHHPNLVTLLGAGTLPTDRPYMILEWLPFDIATMMGRHPKGIPVEQGVRVALQVARALVHLHAQNIVHRDVKAANVLLGGDDLRVAEVRLGDLNLSKVAPQHRSAPGMNISTAGGKKLGTDDYMAPEQWLKSKTVDGAADVYSLGVLVFQMISGTLPFVADDAKTRMAMHLFQEPPMKRLGKHVEPALRELVCRMLRKSSKERPTTIEVLERLETIAITHAEG